MDTRSITRLRENLGQLRTAVSILSLPPGLPDFVGQMRAVGCADSSEFAGKLKSFEEDLLPLLAPRASADPSHFRAWLRDPRRRASTAGPPPPAPLRELLLGLADPPWRYYWFMRDVFLLTEERDRPESVTPEAIAAYGFTPPEADRLSRIIDQIARFYTIADSSICGYSEPIRKLRTDIWTAVFTIDLMGYLSHFVPWSATAGDSPGPLGEGSYFSNSVLVTGETGTGKEEVAKAIHEISDRRGGAFNIVNSGSLPKDNIDAFKSELFGHVKGAFTGASADRKGAFVSAHGGTLFLDEIGDIPAGAQVGILRAIEHRRIRPLGSDRDREVDVRIISATNRDLTGLLARGDFREDLYFRLAGMEIRTPPLEEIKEDIECILRISRKRLLDKLPEGDRLLAEFTRRARSCRWRGNVRELLSSFNQYLYTRQFASRSGYFEDRRSPVGNVFEEAFRSHRSLSEVALDYFSHVLEESKKKDRKRYAQITMNTLKISKHTYLKLLQRTTRGSIRS